MYIRIIYYCCMYKARRAGRSGMCFGATSVRCLAFTRVVCLLNGMVYG